MGRNGIRLAIVEINGVTGEVSSSGCSTPFAGNRQLDPDSSHPRDGAVTFTNSYAIEGHYFQFSRPREWMWDELQVVLPTGKTRIPSSMRFRKRSPKRHPKPQNKRAGVATRGAFAADERSLAAPAST